MMVSGIPIWLDALQVRLEGSLKGHPGSLPSTLQR